MSMKSERSGCGVSVTVGFAANAAGQGVAYGAVGGDRPDIVRVPFSLKVRPALCGRDTAYAAAGAMLAALRRRGVRRLELRLADERLVSELAERPALPANLTVPYVTLRCSLNRFADARVTLANDATSRDLTGRAVADVSLQVAA